MAHYLIVCRSLTYAQRTSAILERSGITARILRAPRSVLGEGCSHGVKVAERHLPQALAVLHRAVLTPKRVLISSEDGSYQEVAV